MGKNKSLPGFRFHPTDVELLKFYLKRKILGKKSPSQVIAEVDIYKYAPWDLPGLSHLKTGDRKWYFFCPVEKKYTRGARLNRATMHGYWKTTGKDRPVRHNDEVVGAIKSLVFHRGKAPRGERTDWIIHEYTLNEKDLAERGVVQDSYVICVVYEKDGMGPGNSAQYGAVFKEEDWVEEDDDDNIDDTAPLFGMSTLASVGDSGAGDAPDSLCIGDTCIDAPLVVDTIVPGVSIAVADDIEGVTTLPEAAEADAFLVDNISQLSPNDFLLEAPLDEDILSLLVSFADDSFINMCCLNNQFEISCDCGY